MTGNHTVAVTGATGYIAGHVVQRLLADGWTVHATARSLDGSSKSEEKLAVLRALQKKYGEARLVLFEANLMQQGSFEEALRGTTAAVHAASPVVQYPDDVESELLRPAAEGTRNVMTSALARAEELRASQPTSTYRVCMLSSIAAITSAQDSHVHSAADWNTAADFDSPYALSKRMAEVTAWQVALGPAAAVAGLELVCVNPGLVVGELLSPRLASSAKPVLDLLTGQFAKCPPMFFSLVAMGDVAEVWMDLRL